MRIQRVLALLLMLSLRAAAQGDTAQSPAQAAPKVEQAGRADDRLKADVLLVVAHPDDESGVSGYLAQLLDQGKRIAAVYLTRGEAGHNNVGRERGSSLGAAREMELRHALTQLGVQNVWFLGGKDTPSQDVLQSLANWDHGARLEEVIRMVRLTRPSVILTWLPGIFIGEDHGDHQAAGVIAVEAFDTAGDPAVFPAQLAQPRHVNETLLEGLQPWQPQKIYFFSDAGDDKHIKGKGPEYPTTTVSPTRHLPYWRISMDTFRFHMTQYRSYIEKIGSMNDEQLNQLASADQDNWSTPVELVFGRSLVPSSVTGDVFEGVQPQPLVFEKLLAPNTKERSGLSVEIGGPWNFYEDFRPAHDLNELPKAEVPEIAVAAGSVLQMPLILRNDDKSPADVDLTTTQPEGWTLKSPLPRYRLSPGDVAQLEVEFTTPTKKSDQINEVTCRAESRGREIGTVILRVRLRSGALPQ